MKLKLITDLLDYLYALSKCNNRVIIFTVKDNAGYWLNDDVHEKLSNLGLEIDLRGKGMVGYVAIIDDKKVIFEEISENGGFINYSHNIGDNTYYIHSAPFNNSNQSIVKINEVDYSTNTRGLNIVVLDKVTNKIEDSVAFDTHLQSFNCSRKIMHHDVGIFGWWYNLNYGACLTYFALNRAIQKMGKSVLMLWRSGESTASGMQIDFAREHYDLSDRCSYSQLRKYNDYVDSFVLGSDQVWNPDLEKYTGDQFFFSFVDRDKKKVAYAQSFGNYTSLPDKFINKYYRLVHNFDAISTREDYASEALYHDFDYENSQVCDPVFLINKDTYQELVDESDIEIEESYCLCFILDPNPEKINYIINAREYLQGKRIICLTDMENSKEKASRFGELSDTVIPGITIQNFLKLYSEADCVITDSFHGTCFSLIYGKPFVSLANYNRGVGRFESLLRLFNQSDRLIKNYLTPCYEKLSEQHEDDTNVIIEEEQARCTEWLKIALNSNIDKRKMTEIEKVDRLFDNPDFKKIITLGTLLRDYGVEHIVLSPGGRDVPIVRMFENNQESFTLHRVVDERSAAYYALGIAAQLQKTVACVCTSGTAVSNFMPAVTEAYFTGVPLIFITADRYEIYHNQGEDQTIQQKDIFKDVTKMEISIPEGTGFNVDYQTKRDISACILETTHNGFGPVHINIAIGDITAGASLSERYWKIDDPILPRLSRVGMKDKKEDLIKWVNSLSNSNRILLVYGQNASKSREEIEKIEAFAKKYNCVIVTDFISNLNCDYCIKSYNMLNKISQDEFNKKLSPDIVITVGGKRLMNDPLTFKIRGGYHNIRHWSVTPSGEVKDFYFRLSSVLEMTQQNFFDFFVENGPNTVNNNEYYNAWVDLNSKNDEPPAIRDFNAHYIQSKFIPAIPENSVLHLGVGQSFFDSRRYNMNENIEVFCNMGTNGIDGCTSTFMGQCAVEKEKLCFLLVGDLSFFYDMNSIWNKPLNKNIRILMVNNSGSGLLSGHNLPGIKSHHDAKAKGWVENCGFKYLSANNAEDYDSILPYFMSKDSEDPLFFEVFCN